MSTARKIDLISVQEYLAGEQVSDVKHEYVGGTVHAMVGATIAHNIIATNVLGALREQLKDSPCREFNSDMKVRIRTASGIRFYYPDAQMVCQSNPQTETFQDSPVLIIEVLSDSTRRVDEEEKKENYLTIPSLYAYVMLEQYAPQAVVHRRTATGFERLACQQPDSAIDLPEIGVELSFAELYRDVVFEQH